MAETARRHLCRGRVPAGAFDGLSAGVRIAPEYADVTDTIDRKIQGIRFYESQLGNLFGGSDAVADAVRGFSAKVAGLGGVPGFAEGYWASAKALNRRPDHGWDRVLAATPPRPPRYASSTSASSRTFVIRSHASA